MAKTTEELLQQAVQIRDEQANKKNTALRVGTLFSDIIQKQEETDKTHATDLNNINQSLKDHADKLTELDKNIIKDDVFKGLDSDNLFVGYLQRVNNHLVNYDGLGDKTRLLYADGLCYYRIKLSKNVKYYMTYKHVFAYNFLLCDDNDNIYDGYCTANGGDMIGVNVTISDNKFVFTTPNVDTPIFLCINLQYGTLNLIKDFFITPNEKYAKGQNFELLNVLNVYDIDQAINSLQNMMGSTDDDNLFVGLSQLYLNYFVSYTPGQLKVTIANSYYGNEFCFKLKLSPNTKYYIPYSSINGYNFVVANSNGVIYGDYQRGIYGDNEYIGSDISKIGVSKFSFTAPNNNDVYLYVNLYLKTPSVDLNITKGFYLTTDENYNSGQNFDILGIWSTENDQNFKDNINTTFNDGHNLYKGISQKLSGYLASYDPYNNRVLLIRNESDGCYKIKLERSTKYYLPNPKCGAFNFCLSDDNFLFGEESYTKVYDGYNVGDSKILDSDSKVSIEGNKFTFTTPDEDNIYLYINLYFEGYDYNIVNSFYVTTEEKNDDAPKFVNESLPRFKTTLGSWCSLGTSITWYNNNQGGKFYKGYQDRVRDKIHFTNFYNKGVSGDTIVGLSNNLSLVVDADYYTVEHGINDWGNSTPVGTMDDYINNTGNTTFYGAYRKVIDKIYEVNPDAKVILCTPRKAYGFGSYLPGHWYDAKNGIYLKEYADAVREIAQYMSFPVCDFFNESQANQLTLQRLSIDDALHPNDAGYKDMAKLLIQAFNKVVE